MWMYSGGQDTTRTCGEKLGFQDLVDRTQALCRERDHHVTNRVLPVVPYSARNPLPEVRLLTFLCCFRLVGCATGEIQLT